jgi:hypothetical protein
VLVAITPRQHALPLVGATKPRRLAPSSAPTEYRPVHVSNYDRKGRDFYATPAWVTEALLRHIRFRGPIWEPCCGAGAISTVLAAHGYDVISTDIADGGFGTPGVDFLVSRSVRDGCRSIITNPPYGEAATECRPQGEAYRHDAPAADRAPDQFTCVIMRGEDGAGVGLRGTVEVALKLDMIEWILEEGGPPLRQSLLCRHPGD